MTTALGGYLAERSAPELAAAIGALAEAAAGLAARLAGPGPLPDAGAAFAAWLPGSGIRWLAGRGNPVAEADPRGSLALALDPLEGDPAAGGPAGTLFSLRAADPGRPEASFLTAGTAILAAGAVVHGPRTRLALATGDRAAGFTLNPAAASFHLTEPELHIPADAPALSADAGDLRLWDRPVRRYLEDCLAGSAGPRAADHSLRWSGCLAAELHAILARGGLFLSPRGRRAPLSLIHQAQPLAAIAEAAGGQATDGERRLLDRVPVAAAGALDIPSPLVFGSPGPVSRVAACHGRPDSEDSPLFGRRGLFRL